MIRLIVLTIVVMMSSAAFLYVVCRAADKFHKEYRDGQRDDRDVD